ncbi:MAG TPA: PD-(D/E)XK nuclease family protein, partial [Candidatus Obscuribacterales bacterium]
MSTTKPSIRATDIAEYIRYQSCDRRFKLKFDNYELAKQIPFSELIFATSLDPVLEEAGRIREREWETLLQKYDFLDLTQISKKSSKNQATEWNEFVKKIESLPAGQDAYGREISIEGNLEEFNVRGQIDFIVVLWENNEPKLRLVECKASRKDRTYHQAQVALYRMLVREIIKENPITISGVILKSENIECVVVRIDENTNKSQDIIQSQALNLDTIEADISRLI